MDRQISLALVKGDNYGGVAGKLHRQFGHPRPERLIRLIRESGNSSKRLEGEVERVSKGCEVCARHRKAKPRPVVCMPLASKFNDVIAMDLKAWGNRYFMVVVDLATRYCVATVVGNKNANTIVKALFLSWVVIFGAPNKILSDNGGEFNNSDMHKFGEAFNVKIMTTAAESPWSNGVCERLNGVLGDMVRKVIADCGCDVEVALAWAVSARNALSNNLGFSPNQLVFGHNPGAPNVFENGLPGLEPVTSSEMVRSNLNALHAARQAFVKLESNERLSRALRHNVRSNDVYDVQGGEEVYYKRNDSNVWRGPGTVIGRDGKTVMVKHGGQYVRAHECRLTHVPIKWEERVVRPSGETGGPVGDKGVKLSDRSPDDDGGYFPNIDQDDEDNVVRPVHVAEEQGMDRVPVGQGVDRVVEIGQREPQREPPVRDLDKQPMRLKTGMRIKGVRVENGEVVTGSVVSRAGKAGGRHGDCYNFKWDSDGNVSWADLNGDFESWELIDDDEEVLVLFASDKVYEAKVKELDNWKDNDVFVEVEDRGQRCLSVRWVITDKVKEGKNIIKARLVARGFEEDTRHIRKDSPTCSKESVRLALSVAATFGWECHSLDVKSAYLQGNPIEREVYVRPPPEFDDGYIWRLRKTVYGLCDAARHWYLRVSSQLIELGARRCSVDPALFSWRKDGQLDGVICVYVDDLFWAGGEVFREQVIDRLSEVFVMGSSETKAFKYLGLNIESQDDGSITLDQNSYAATLTPINISKQRTSVRTSELSEKERAEYRALLGQMTWIGTHTRPDIAFEVCELSGLCSKATVGDLMRLNKLIERVRTGHWKVFMPRMEKLEECSLECFSDASFANMAGSGSQGGFVIFLRSGDGRRCPIYWQSRRIRRVVKSTLSAEAMALVECTETAVYLQYILSEIADCGRMKIRCYVDNRGLVDSLQSDKGIEDRRLRIDIAVLRDMLDKGELEDVSWVDTKSQLADCLTKRGASAETLREAVFGHRE